MIKLSELKKEDKIKHRHCGPEVSGVIKESPIQGRGLRTTILVDVKGSEIGGFDEIGSIYSNEITKVLRDNKWQAVDLSELNADQQVVSF